LRRKRVMLAGLGGEVGRKANRGRKVNKSREGRESGRREEVNGEKKWRKHATRKLRRACSGGNKRRERK
jgi:hypothetical protein